MCTSNYKIHEPYYSTLQKGWLESLWIYSTKRQEAEVAKTIKCKRVGCAGSSDSQKVIAVTAEVQECLPLLTEPIRRLTISTPLTRLHPSRNYTRKKQQLNRVEGRLQSRTELTMNASRTSTSKGLFSGFARCFLMRFSKSSGV